MLTFEFQVSLPVIAQFTFHGNASSYAFLTGSMGFGAALGGIFFASRKSIKPYSVVSASLLFGLAVLAAAFMPSLLFTGLALVLVGICSINFSSLGNSILQLGELAANPRPGHVILVDRFFGFHNYRRADCRLVCGSNWARWGLALGGMAAVIAAALGAVILRNVQTGRAIRTG